MSVKVKFKIGEKKGITANYTVNNNNPIRTVFKIDAASAAFYSLTGSPYDNANLKDALDAKADKSELESDMAAVDEAISNVQTVVENNYNTLDNKIDNVNSDLSGDISTLENTVNSNNTAVNNRIDTTNQTVAELSTTVADNNTAINNRVDGIVDSFDGDISNLETAIQNEAATRANNDTLLQGDINTLQTNLTAEISNRTSADNTLQDNIDTLSSDLADETTARENADTTLQGNINTLSNTVTSNYNTLDGKITTLSGTVSSNYNTLDTKIDNTKSAIDSDISDLSDTVNQNYTDLNNAITTSASTINSRIDTEVNTLNTAITTENTQRQAADSNLQSQIDAITSASDVFDIVGTYAELEAYDISTVPPNDIIKVLVDSTHNNAATYYRCVENDGVKSWTYIGSEGAYYTKSEADNTFVAKTTTINNKPLSSNITLTASDVNALPADTVIGSGVITLQKNGVNIDSFNVNATANKSINISVPTDTSELTNNAGYITNSALNGYAKTADLATVATSGSYNDLDDKPTIPAAQVNADWNATSGVAQILNKPTIPTVGNGTVTINQGGTQKGTFTLNQSGNTTINLDGLSYVAGTGIEIDTSSIPIISIDSTVVATKNELTDFVTISELANEILPNYARYDEIPTVNDPIITFTQGGINKGTITLNQSTNQTIALDAGGVIDQTFDGTSQNAQSGVAIQGELSTNYQSKLVSGTNIKTVNNQSLLGSGNINVSNTDDTTISKNSDDELQSIGVIDDNVQNAYNFTVVGSPTITDDGIASGFSSSNYIVPNNLSYFASAITDLDFYVPFKLSNYPAARELVARGQYNSSFRFLIAIDGNRTAKFNFSTFDSETIVIPATDLELNVNYIIKLSLHQGTLKYGYYKNNTYTETGSIQVSSIDTMNWLRIGSGNSSAGFVDGSIDLKQFSITVDGVEVYRAWQPPALKYWTGTKAQYDALTFDNYTVVGSPTITADGIASGFSSSNGIFSELSITNHTTWDISFKFTSPLALINSNKRIVKFSPNNSFMCCLDGSKLRVWFGNGSSWFIESNIVTSSITTNTEYNIEIKFTGNAYEVYINNILTSTITSTTQIPQSITNVYIGYDAGMTANYFTGSIDLKQLKITVGGTEVYRAFGRPDANTLYNVEGVGLYKGTTLISNDGANIDLSNLSSTGNSKFQTPLVSGTNIKTINNTSLLGSGNIDTSEIFVAEYGTTTYQEVLDAYNAGKVIFTKQTRQNPYIYIDILPLTFYDNSVFYFKANSSGSTAYSEGIYEAIVTLSSSGWDNTGRTAATDDLSNVWRIDSSSIVANKDLSDLSTTGQAVIDGQWNAKYLSVFSGVTAIGNGDYSISSYLPNDGHAYEVLACMQMNDDGTTSGTDSAAAVGNVANPLDNNCFRIMGNSDKGIWKPRFNGVLVFLGNQRKVYYQITGRALHQGLSLQFFGYRRIGTNS